MLLTRRRSIAGTIAVGLAFVTANATAASADSATDPWVLACIAVANANGATEGICSGGEVSYVVRSANGSAANVVSPIPGYTKPVTERGASRASSDITTMALEDDWENWCEGGAECIAYRSMYIAQVKRNQVYFWGSTPISGWDQVLKVRLNGRQPQWQAWFNHDFGPQVAFRSAQVNCVKDQTFDGSCGQFKLDGDGAFVLDSTWPTMNSGVIYNNRLDQSDDYFGTITSQARPTNNAQFNWATVPTVRLPNFNCFGTGNCYFPNSGY